MLKDNLREKYKNRRRDNDVAHISDLIESNCMRKAYYRRKIPEQDNIDDATLIHFLRGESSQYAITQLANFEDTEFEIATEDGTLTGHIDAVYKNEKGKLVVVELKDSNSMTRYDLDNDTFKSYETQLLYYLALSGIELGVICIKYNCQSMRWAKKDSGGSTWYEKQPDSRPPEIIAYDVVLTKDDPLRAKLLDELLERKSRFLLSLETNDVTMLPRLWGAPRFIKCPKCPYNSKCYQEDDQTKDAVDFGSKVSVIDQLVADVTAEI